MAFIFRRALSLFVAVFLLGMGWSGAVAQVPQGFGESPGQTGLPCLRGNTNWRDIFAGQPYPSGEQNGGMVLQYNVAQGKCTWAFPHILAGPGALSSPVTLSGGASGTYLDGSPGATPGPSFGERPGLAQYPPWSGVFILYGQLTIDPATTNTKYEIQVTAGNSVSAPVTQPNILVGSPYVIGGGSCSSGGTIHVTVSCPFNAPIFELAPPWGFSTEVRVKVFTSDTAGVVQASSANIPAAFLSNLMVLRVAGPGVRNQQ